MDKVVRKKILLGALITVGLILFLAGVFLIGSKQDLFTSTITVMTNFRDVGGLRKGDYVRYSGVRVGVVSEVKIINDTTVQVSMRLHEDMSGLIRKNATVSLASDGLMGNKIVRIKSAPAGSMMAAFISDMDTLRSVNSMSMEDVMQRLANIGDNASTLMGNLSEISTKLNKDSGVFHMLVSDTAAAKDLKYILGNFRVMSRNTVTISDRLLEVVDMMEHGDGTAAMLLSDTALAGEIRTIIGRLDESSRYMQTMMSDLSGMMKEKGTLQMLMKDTALSAEVRQSIINVEQASDKLNQNMEALQHNIFLRRFFRKEEKKNEKQKK